MGASIFRSTEVRRAVVDIDLVRYSDIVKSLEIGHQLGANAAAFVNQQIESLIRRSIVLAGADPQAYVKGTGDGAILQLESATAADCFATALHELAHREHSAAASNDLEWRSFRIGIHSGDVILSRNEIAGAVVGFATRLQAGARSGETMIDAASWAELPQQQKAAYGPEEVLQVKKHDPQFRVHRRRVVEPAPWEVHEQRTGKRKATVWYLPDRDRNPNFIGRAAEIESIHRQLNERGIAAVTETPDARTGNRISALVGLGGIGKTQTAVEYAFRYAHEYDYVFFVHADDVGKIRRDYGQIARLLGVQAWEKGLQGLVEASLDWMRDHDGWLLIVDNIDDPHAVAPYVPSRGRGHVLMTSRLQTMDAFAARVDPVSLGLLGPEDSRELLIRTTGRGGAHATPVEEAAITNLIQALDGLPVALEQAAIYIRNLPCTFADYWEEFNLRRTRLFASPLAQPKGHEGLVIADRDRAIATTWDISFRHVEAEASAAEGPQAAAPDLLLVSAFLSPDDIPMRLLSAGAGELGPRVAAALRHESHLNVQEALHLLHKFSLIEVKLETRAYRMHRLVQEVVRKWWMTQEQRLLWAKRVIAVLRRGTGILHASEGNYPSALKDQHFASFVAAILLDEWKQEDFEFEEAAELLSQAGYLLTKTDRYHDANRFLERAIAIRERLLGPEDLRVAETLNHYANNLAEWGHNAQAVAYYERALGIRVKRQGADHDDVAQVHNDFGIALFNLGNYEEAEKHYLEASRIWRKHGDNNLVGSAEFNLAMVYRRHASKRKIAEEYFQRAYEKVITQHMRAHACREYGGFLHANDRTEEALPVLREGRKCAINAFGKESREILKYNRSLRAALEKMVSMKVLPGGEAERKKLRAEIKALDRETQRIAERVEGGDASD